MPKSTAVSISVIKRLPRYHRFLEELIAQNVTRISSRELSDNLNLTASQIRQDLNCFGGFGQQGYGYVVVELYSQIGKILGVDMQYKTIVIGAGNLGKAIATHMDFEKRGCQLIAIFDNDKSIIGTKVADCIVRDVHDIASFCKKNNPTISVLCIPKSAAQALADQLIKLGIIAFWNFSHYDLKINSESIIVENAHLSDSLLTLTYGITHSVET